MDYSDRCRFAILGVLVIGLITMGLVFGLGKVESATSFGLGQVLTIISLVTYEGAKWAYKRSDKDEDSKDDKQ